MECTPNKPPELTPAFFDIQILTPRAEAVMVDLLANIQASLEAKLDSYKIGEDLEYADLVKYIYVDFTTGRAFSGIDDVSIFSLTCKSTTITGFGQKVTLDDDERIEPGTLSVTEAT